MSVIELRREFRKLQEEFMGGALSKLKKHEVEHRMAALKSAMAIKADTPAPPPASAGAPGAREVKSKEVLIDDETVLTKPVAPKGGMKHATSYKKGVKKTNDEPSAAAAATVAHVADTPAPAAAPASAAPAAKKVRRVPPKLELADDAPAATPVEAAAKPERKIIKKPVAKKEKVSKAPKAEKAAPEPAAPVAEAPVAKPIKMPGGVRPIPGAEISFA
jgi:hypothetical protein